MLVGGGHSRMVIGEGVTGSEVPLPRPPLISLGIDEHTLGMARSQEENNKMNRLESPGGC